MSDAKIAALRARYEAGLHGMQAGVALDQTHDSANLSPKHLRVGVNAAMVDSGALAKCLIDKGVITEEEYCTALAEIAERERATYEEKYTALFGSKVTLV